MLLFVSRITIVNEASTHRGDDNIDTYLILYCYLYLVYIIMIGDKYMIFAMQVIRKNSIAALAHRGPFPT